MYNRTLVLGTCVRVPLWVSAPAAAALATCVAEKAKNRKRKVPMNSPTMATKWFLILLGMKPMHGMRSSFLWPGRSRPRRPGKLRPLICGRSKFMVPARCLAGGEVRVRVGARGGAKSAVGRGLMFRARVSWIDEDAVW